MKKLFASLLLVLAFSLDCTPKQLQTANDVKDGADAALTVLELACVWASSALTSADVAKACNLMHKFKSVADTLDNLIGARETVKRANVGFVWKGPPPSFADAGTADAAK